MNKVLFFQGNTCGPCKQMHEVVDKVRETYNFPLSYIDAFDEDNMELNDKYNVGSVPSFVIINDNDKALTRFTGVFTEDEFLDQIKPYF